MYALDPTVQEKILHRKDRAAVEAKLAQYPLEQQKRWVANPIVEWLLESYLQNLTRGVAATGSSTKSTGNATAKASETLEKKSESESEEEEMYSLFD